MKIFVLIILFVVCLSAQAQDKTKTFEDAKAGFSLSFPTSWTTVPGYMGTNVISLSPPEENTDTYRENFSVVAENLPKQPLVNDYAQMYLNIMKHTKNLKDLTVKEPTSVTIAGQPALKVLVTYTQGNAPYTTEEYFLVRGNRGYVITASALTATYESYKQKFGDIVASLKFTD